MPRIYESGIINTSPEKVWKVIRDFNGLPEWHPGIKSSELEGGDGVGTVRHFFLNDGGELREKLWTLSDIDYLCSYSIVESPMFLKNYHSTFRLYPVTDSGITFMEWFAYFDMTDLAAEKDTVEAVSGVFSGGIKSLQDRFS